MTPRDATTTAVQGTTPAQGTGAPAGTPLVPAPTASGRDQLPAPVHELTADEARRAALFAQGLIGVPDRRAGVTGLLRRLGAIQLDTISVLARSHELVPYARLGAVGRKPIEQAYWGHQPHAATAFEYWAHAASVLPVAEWPTLGWRRARYREMRRGAWHGTAADRLAAVREKIAEAGPMTATELGGAKRPGEWWSWSDTKIAVEQLLSYGEVVCVARRGWKRVYDLPERALPSAILNAPELDQNEGYRRLVTLTGRALGVGTIADIADYYRLKQEGVAAVLPDTGLVPVSVVGWDRPAWADPTVLDLLAAGGPRGRHRTTLLSPFDSLIWDRARTERLFGFAHRLEAYVPRDKREHGYFAMPLLAGGRLLGRADPARVGTTLVARQVSVRNAAAVAPMATALREAATWVGCDAVRVERVVPEHLAQDLRAACS